MIANSERGRVSAGHHPERRLEGTFVSARTSLVHLLISGTLAAWLAPTHDRQGQELTLPRPVSDSLPATISLAQPGDEGHQHEEAPGLLRVALWSHCSRR